MSVTFNLQDLNPGTDFEYPGGATVKIRMPDTDTMSLIQKKSATKKAEFKSAEKGQPLQRIEWLDFQDEDFRKLYWDYIIVSWTGFNDSNGNEISCTTENKLLLMGKSNEFASFVNKSLETLRKDFEKKQEDASKNSEIS